MYLSDMEPAMKPSDAYAKMAHREIERVPVDQLEGRVTADPADAVPAGHSAADSGRTLQPDHRRVPEVRARVQRAASRASRPTSTAWWKTRWTASKAYFVDCVKQ